MPGAASEFGFVAIAIPEADFRWPDGRLVAYFELVHVRRIALQMSSVYPWEIFRAHSPVSRASSQLRQGHVRGVSQSLRRHR